VFTVFIADHFGQKRFEDAKGVEAMCRAMEDMRKEAAAEQNILTLLGAIKNLMKNLGMSAEQAMTALGVSDSERGILIKRI
jgi:predicted XRE-type DNA-binding protein